MFIQNHEEPIRRLSERIDFPYTIIYIRYELDLILKQGVENLIKTYVYQTHKR